MYATTIDRVRAALTPDLLSPKWRSRVRPSDPPTTGHCYIAAEALYHLGPKREGFRPHVISGRQVDGEDWTHWYLADDAGRILDPTSDQFGEEDPPYEYGRPCGFLTREPSRRARALINRIRRTTDHEKREA